MDKKPTKPTATRKKGPVSNAVKLDAKTPIPLETGGRGYIIQEGRKYVPFFDGEDNFFQVLLEACLLSPTNLACVNSKTKFSIGKGWMITGEQEDKELITWAKSVNKKGQSLNDIFKGAFNNRYNAGNSFIEVITSEVASTKYVKVFLRNYIDCRLVIPTENDDIPTHVVVSKKFRKTGVWNLDTKKDYVEIPIYTGQEDQDWYEDEKGHKHVMIYLKNEVSGYDYYGMPSNVACLPQQVLEYKMARYNMDNFDNNMVIGGLIILQGNMTPDESKKIAKEITTAHTGDGKRGKYVILSSENGVENSKVLPFDQQKEYDYIKGSERVEAQIFTSNEWSKVLIDPQAGGLGNSGKQIREIYETKMNTVIGPEQSNMIEKFMKPLMEICSRHMNKNWNSYDFGFKNIPILGISSEIDVNSCLTVDEGRIALGFPALGGTEGKKMIKTSKDVQNQPNG